MTLSGHIAQWLAEKEITHAFGIVGGGNVSLWGAIAQLGKTQIVSVHHEQAAVMAAAAYFRTSGRLAAALVTTGAGSTNAITGVMAAWMDSTPVLVLSGNEATKFMDKFLLRTWGVQGYDSSRFAARCTKETARIGLKDDWLFKAEFCRQQALDKRQGPVWIDIPQDAQRAVV